MKSDVTYDLLIIGGGISACVFASKYLKNNITKKVGLIEIGRGLGGCLLYTSPSPRDFG